MFHFAIAKLGLASLWIDYVPSESNPADIPSRVHAMSAQEAEIATAGLGIQAPLTIPKFCDELGDWLSFSEIASSVW